MKSFADLTRCERLFIEACETGYSVHFVWDSASVTGVIRPVILTWALTRSPLAESGRGSLHLENVCVETPLDVRVREGALRAQGRSMNRGPWLPDQVSVDDDRLLLDRQTVPMSVRFKLCTFAGGISMRHARARDWGLVGCTMRAFESEAGRYRRRPNDRPCVRVSLDAYGARFDGRVVMASSSQRDTEIDGVVNLSRARVTGILNMRGAKCLAGCVSLDLSGIEAEGVFLTRGFYASGTVYAHACRIRGEVSVDGAQFGGPRLERGAEMPTLADLDSMPLSANDVCRDWIQAGSSGLPPQLQPGVSLCFRYAVVGELFRMGAGFVSHGTVDLKDARIGGALDLWGGRFRVPRGVAILAEGLRVASDVVCSRPPSPPTVAHSRTASPARADADEVDTRTLGRRYETRVWGEATFSGARIGGEADFSHVTFLCPVERRDGRHEKSSIALSLYMARVGGRLRLGHGFYARGVVAMDDCRVEGSVDFQGGWFLNPGGVAIAANRLVVQGDVRMPRKWTEKDIVSRLEHGDPTLLARGGARPTPQARLVDTRNATLSAAATEVARRLIGHATARGSGDIPNEGPNQLGWAIGEFVRLHRDAGRRAERIGGTQEPVFEMRQLLPHRFVALGTVSFKAAHVHGDFDAAGGFFYCRLPAGRSNRLYPELYAAAGDRVSGFLSRWTALDLSYATIGRSLFVTRWVPHREPEATHDDGDVTWWTGVFPTFVAGVLDLTGTDVHQLHVTPTLFTRRHGVRGVFRDAPAQPAVVLTERLTYDEVHPVTPELVKAQWFFSGLSEDASQQNEQLSLALRRQGLHQRARLALLRRPRARHLGPSSLVGWLRAAPRVALLGIVHALFPWWKSVVWLMVLICVGWAAQVSADASAEPGAVWAVPDAAEAWLRGDTEAVTAPAHPELRVSATSIAIATVLPGPRPAGRGAPARPRLSLVMLVLSVLGGIATSTLVLGIASVFRRP